MKGRISIAITLFALAIAVAVAQSTRIELRAKMRDGAAEYSSKYKQRDTRGRVRGELEVEIQNGAPNTEYVFLIQGIAPIVLETDAAGMAANEAHLRAGALPPIVAGTAIAVADPEGNVLASSTFQPR
ncbi:MAG: hypothetical protein KIS66_16840 [Fimbriimonadaceae bacterium]|nr:hypothetical protein [Fimbriimonadaceae bacterium]